MKYKPDNRCGILFAAILIWLQKILNAAQIVTCPESLALDNGALSLSLGSEIFLYSAYFYLICLLLLLLREAKLSNSIFLATFK